MGSLQAPIQPEPLLSVKQLAAALGMSTDWVYSRTSQRAADPLPFIPAGRSPRFHLSKVLRHLERRRRPAGSANVCAIDGIARVNGKEYRRVTRRRFQTGHVRLREDRTRPWWEGFYREDIVLSDGQITRRLRSVNLGRLAEVPTKRKAQRKLAEILTGINQDDYRPRGVLTVREFVEQKFKPLKLANKKWTTQQGYQSVLNRTILPAIGDLQVAEVTAEDAQELINAEVAAGCSRNTAKNIKFAASSVFSLAVKYDYIKSNPFRSVDLPPEEVRFPERTLTPVERKKLLKALPQRERMMVWLIGLTGARPNENVALRRNCVDFRNKLLWVREAINRGHVHTPKGHRQQLPIRLTSADLARFKKLLASTPGAKETDWLFPNQRGTGPVEYSKVMERRIQPIAEKVLGFRITWRMLRKTASTVMHEQGVAVKAMQVRLGHTRAETTMKHYTQLTDPSADHAARVMSQAWTAALADVEKVRSKRRHRKSVSQVLARPKGRAASA